MGNQKVCRSIDVSRRTGRAITRRLDAGAVRWLARWFITNIRFYFPPHYTLHITRSNRLCFLYIHHRHPPSDEKVPKCILYIISIYIYIYYIYRYVHMCDIIIYIIYFRETSSIKFELWKRKKIYKTLNEKSKKTLLLSKKPKLIPFDSFSRRFVILLSKLELLVPMRESDKRCNNNKMKRN